MSDDLVRVKNRDTDEVLLIGRPHLARWPDDPYDVIDESPEPSPSGEQGTVPPAYVDQAPPTSSSSNF